VIGPAGDDQLKAWLRGIPRPKATWRTHRLLELRKECRRLRLEGMSYSEIAAVTGASAGSLGLWLRDLEGAPSVRAARARHAFSGPQAAGRGRARAAARQRDERLQKGAELIGVRKQRDLLVLGVVTTSPSTTTDVSSYAFGARPGSTT